MARDRPRERITLIQLTIFEKFRAEELRGQKEFRHTTRAKMQLKKRCCSESKVDLHKGQWFEELFVEIKRPIELLWEKYPKQFSREKVPTAHLDLTSRLISKKKRELE